MAKKLDFWCSYGSTYTYLTVMRIEDIAAAEGIEVEWKPFHLPPIYKSMGWSGLPFVQFPEKARYMWSDLVRRAKVRGLPYHKPSVYPVDNLLTTKVALVAAAEGWCPEFSRRVFHGNFVDGRVIGEADNLQNDLRSLGKDPGEIIRIAESRETESLLNQRTDEAVKLGIFGAPFFVVVEELFWGDDRLEDAVEWCLTHE